MKKIIKLNKKSSTYHKLTVTHENHRIWGPQGKFEIQHQCGLKKKAVVLAVQMLMFSEYFCNANSKAGAPLKKK